MRFYFFQHFLYVLLPLVALTCATEASSLRAKRSVLNDIGNTLNNIGQTIKDTVKPGIDSLFHQHSTTKPERILSPTLEPEWNETESRQIITAPIRCPPNHELVKNRCRLKVR
ncbi:uncharacterized protein LOC105423812 [Pogonomyrmex barbatus]|uniref:Uncharacterized protein LOC105423812 n=1 Tax=Pogonomyrmex barbatus TaxID=144034 RepID=A0A6I9VY29_9HYME|nr:uncharacterized protein LOC105423812 [Pogonomyrmex barbatus]